MTANSMDAVSDRDFILEFLSSASICMMHFSRISEELIIWSSSEFDFIELSDAFATGSSIMPQKKNPDVPEIVRGKAGRVFGSLIAVLTIMKSLPLAYNRDMQEDKPPLFDAADTLLSCIDIYIRMLPEILVKKEKMRSAASTGFLNATDMADYLVGKGVAFRDAHECVGKAVSYALGEGKELHDLSIEELKRFSGEISDDIFECLTVDSMINRRISDGGTAGEKVKAAVYAAKKELGKEQVG
jgi:argininosuccinate lyase